MSDKNQNKILNYEKIKSFLNTKRIQEIAPKYIDVENNTTINLSMNDNRPIFIIGNITNAIKNLDIVSDTLFYHNPYVNRMWSQIYLSSNKEL